MFLCCRFVDVSFDGQLGTVLLENPVGVPLVKSAKELQQLIGTIFGTPKRLSTVADKLQPLTAATVLDSLNGQTLYLL